jgi:hypothetical protein
MYIQFINVASRGFELTFNPTLTLAESLAPIFPDLTPPYPHASCVCTFKIGSYEAT